MLSFSQRRNIVQTSYRISADDVKSSFIHFCLRLILAKYSQSANQPVSCNCVVTLFFAVPFLDSIGEVTKNKRPDIS
jgi:hypothetical protein